MQPKDLFQTVAILAISFAPFLAQADVVHGTTMGSTVTAPALAAHPNNRDDINTSTTIDVTFLSSSDLIPILGKSFSGYNFVFASLEPGTGPSAPPDGLNVRPIDPGDFTIDQYKPWVVDNNDTANFLVDPSGTKASLGVTAQDAGGANILILYTPLNDGDPTHVNFLQAFEEAINGEELTNAEIDNGGITASPYYNYLGLTGNGILRANTVPLTADLDFPAWLGDLPFYCEDNPVPPSPKCQFPLREDDQLTLASVTFQTFIESDQICSADACGDNKGKTYQVLYGGVQWGFKYTNEDPVPEPSYAILLAVGFAGIWLGRRFRRLSRPMA